MAPINLRLVRGALLSIAAAAVTLCAFFLVGLVAIVWRDHDRPQFPYEVAITAAGAIYFGALVVHTGRGLKRVLEEARLSETIGYLSQSVLGMFIPVAMAAAFLLWLVFQPAY